MTDELDILKTALKGSPPPPDPDRRDAAIAAAMAAFDTAQDELTQGSTEDARQRDRQSGPLIAIRRFMMTLTLPSLKTMMMGGASLAVLTLAVVTTVEMQRPAPEPVAATGGILNMTGPATAPQTEERPLAVYRNPAAGGTGAPTTTDQVFEAAPAPMPQNIPLPGDSGTLAAKPKVGNARARAAGDGMVGGVQKRVAAPVEAEADLNRLDAPARPVFREEGRDAFPDFEPNPIQAVAENPVSTFSVDVDTASYSFMRASLMGGTLPPGNAVRIEELVNYFPYAYAPPETRETPFRAHVSVMPTPWNADTQLMRIGIKGYDLAPTEKPRANLVFLLDTSGSMNAPEKLPLLINSFRLLVQSLDADDTVSIVVYAGSAGTVLEPTPARDQAKIFAALDRLRAGGSTAGGEGIRQAYQLAESNFDPDGVNRVILATDGDFNVGISDPDALKSFISRKRDSGVFLSVLGFGRGNYNDALMQTLAQNGNGQAAYIDTLAEARKTLVEEAGSALFPIAKDVKIQVEFNPATVAEYRLIGYETRALRREDFNNDRIDAGEIGAGHTVTALYEITPVGSPATRIDPLRYQTPTATEGPADEYAFLRIRYKAPDSDTSQLIETPVTRAAETDGDDDARFAAAVAAFGQLLKGGRYTGDFSYADVVELANGAKGDDPFGYRAEFVTLARLAATAAALAPERP